MSAFKTNAVWRLKHIVPEIFPFLDVDPRIFAEGKGWPTLCATQRVRPRSAGVDLKPEYEARLHAALSPRIHNYASGQRRGADARPRPRLSQGEESPILKRLLSKIGKIMEPSS